MLSFIRRHWVAYAVGAALALLLGFGAAWFVGVKCSTPEDVRAERIKAEQAATQADKQLEKDTAGSNEVSARRSKHISVKKR